MTPRRILGVAAVIGVSVAVFAACGDKGVEQFKDADRGATNSGAADTITFPDGFSNVATKCDNGNRVYVLFKGDLAYGSIAVVPKDPTCSTP